MRRQTDAARLRRGPGIRRRANAWLAAATLSSSLAGTAASADSLLESGAWTGSYQPLGSDPVDVTYRVAEDPAAPSGWTIRIQMELDPREAWAFDAQDLKADAERVKFVFGKGGDLQKCRLAPQDTTELVGSCRPGDEPDAPDPARIVMKRPVPTPGE